MFINALKVCLLRAALSRQAVHALTADQPRAKLARPPASWEFGQHSRRGACRALSRLAVYELTLGCWLRTGRGGARGHRDARARVSPPGGFSAAR